MENKVWCKGYLYKIRLWIFHLSGIHGSELLFFDNIQSQSITLLELSSVGNISITSPLLIKLPGASMSFDGKVTKVD